MNLPCQILSCHARLYKKSIYTVNMIFKHSEKRNHARSVLFPIMNLSVVGCDPPPQSPIRRTRPILNEQKFDRFVIKLTI